jgi:cobalt-zinc-cadmium efflux system outer membrane protein
VKKAESQVDVARAETVAARAYPNPTLSYQLLYGLQSPEYVNGTQHQVTLEQPVLIGGQRGAREAAADLDVRAARARAQADFHDIAQRVRASFVSLLAAEQRVHVLDDARADLERAKRIVEVRAQGGLMSDFDRVRTDMEAHALDAREAAARTEFDDASGRLASLVGLPNWRPRAVGALGEPARARPDSGNPVAAVPSVVAADKELSSARAQIDVAKSERWPTPVFGIGALFTTNGYALAGSLGLAIDLPLFDRNQGGMARAQAQEWAAERARNLAVADATTELARAEHALGAREQGLSDFERDVMARLPDMRRMAEDAYTSGRGTVLDLLDTLRTSTDLRLTEIDYLEARALARVDLLAAEGRIETD